MYQQWLVFDKFFRQGSGGYSPFPYQQRLAEMEKWPDLARIPTGLGKTLAVELSWIWRRRFHPNPAVRRATPHRLIYVLPMRTLVEQTTHVAEKCLTRLDLRGSIGVHQLLGGDVNSDWALYPEREAIVVGTQDMLLSRALNRGYALSRFEWPRQYGLLNADALWVVDEVQLMGSALATTVQLDYFRHELGTIGPTHTLWMSATAEPEWLTTADKTTAPTLFELNASDREHPIVLRRLTAAKRLRALPGSDKLATAILRVHQQGTRTLVVCNTVDRAKKLFQEIQRTLDRGARDGTAGSEQPDVLLIHGQFRPVERLSLDQRLMERVNPHGPGVIVLATQVVEAGVDISARTLVTELAPWASLVQRFGRCNRFGDDARGEVYWIDLADKDAAPYELEDLKAARAALRRLEGQLVSPEALQQESTPLAYRPMHVVRRRDVMGLFDTTPDLAGADLDVSRFVRDGEDRDVQVFWRDISADGSPPAETPRPGRDELCPAPLADARDLAKHHPLYRWDALDGTWTRTYPNDIRPAMVLLAPSRVGSYDPLLGWHKESRQPVEPVAKAAEDLIPEEATDDDARSMGAWQSLDAHTAEVRACLDEILASLPEVDHAAGPLLRQSVRLHDWGKSHRCFQEMLLSAATPEERTRYAGTLLAKSPRRGQPNERRHFRHELASALALLACRGVIIAPFTPVQRDLIAYLVASHHGKVRVGLRSLPGEIVPPEGVRFALGIWEGDCLPEVPLTDGVLPATVLSLESMEMGRGPDGAPSWMERTLALRDDLEWGPFRLALLEAILRAADVRASMGLAPMRTSERERAR